MKKRFSPSLWLFAIMVAHAGIAPAQERIDDTDAPVSPIPVKQPPAKGGVVKAVPPAASTAPAPGVLGTPPSPAAGRGTVVTSTSTPGGAQQGATAKNATPVKNGKPDLKAELPPAVDSGRGVLRRPAGNIAAGGSLKIDMGYSNPVTPQTARLPGLGYPPGAVDQGKPLILHTANGVNEIVNVSSQFANRVVTPFEQPKILAPEDVEATVVGNSIYVSLGDQEPRAIYIVDKTGKSAAAISLTMMPQAIPPQTIIVQMEGVDKGLGNDPTNTTNKENSYEQFLRNIMRTVARGTTPAGYTEETLTVGVSVSNDIRATPNKRYSGSENDIYRYQLENTGTTLVTLSEEAFAIKGVRAVSFFPKLALAPGEKTDVIILLDKEQ